MVGTLLLGLQGTKVIERMMSYATLGRGRGGTNDNDSASDMIKCGVIGGGGGIIRLWWRVYNYGMTMIHAR